MTRKVSYHNSRHLASKPGMVTSSKNDLARGTRARPTTWSMAFWQCAGASSIPKFMRSCTHNPSYVTIPV
jgi:hypothetical protein